MKKRLVSALTLLLAALILAGCGLAAAAPVEEQLPFDEMVYVRPDLTEMDALMEELYELLDAGFAYWKVRAKLDECFDWYYSFYTMYTLAEVHSYLDVTDAYYAEEYEWISGAFAELQQTMEDLYYACAASRLGGMLEKFYFWEGFCEEYSDPEDSVYSDEYVKLLQEETDLLARYREMIAAPTVAWEGEDREISELLAELYGFDYYDALRLYYETWNEPLAEIYIKLIRVRRAMAECLGYDSYEQMQYEYFYERDYSPEEAAIYLAEIRRTAVPFYKMLMALGAYSQVWYDEVDEDTLFDILGRTTEEIGGDVAEAFGFMDEYGLYDVSVNQKKAQISFQTYFPDYHAPFVFLGAVGDTEDVLSFAHEFGHFCDAYVNEGALNESIDLAEVFSQSMELIVLTRLPGLMDGEDVDNIARLKAIDLADMYVQQAAFAEFETRVYTLDDDALSADALNEIMLELSKDYGFYSRSFDWAYAMSWIDITHFFEAPFYVISYPVSNDLAMQIYAMELAEEGSGAAKYLEVLRHDYTQIMELVEDGGFASPFEEGCVQEAVKLLKQMYGMR